MLDQLADALGLCGRDGHHGYAELPLQQVDIDGAAVCRDLVHHVEGYDHGTVKLHELEREVEVSLDIGCIDDVYHRVWARV